MGVGLGRSPPGCLFIYFLMGSLMVQLMAVGAGADRPQEVARDKAAITVAPGGFAVRFFCM